MKSNKVRARVSRIISFILCFTMLFAQVIPVYATSIESTIPSVTEYPTQGAPSSESDLSSESTSSSDGTSSGEIPNTTEFVSKSSDEFTVTFDANGGLFNAESGEPTATYEVLTKVGYTVVIPVAKPTRASDETVYYYKLSDNWYTDMECTKPYNFTTPVTSNITLYAKWVPITQITVKFNQNDVVSTNNPNDQAVAISKDKLANVTAPTWADIIGAPDTKLPITLETHQFLGWTLEKEPKVTDLYWDFENHTITSVFENINKNTSTLTLYAQWEVVDLFKTGTADKPFLINSKDPLTNIWVLNQLAQKVNSGTSYSECYFELTQSVDLTGKVWTPIGTEEKPFSGHFTAGVLIKQEISALEKISHFVKSLFVKAPTETLEYSEIKGLNLTGSGENQGFFGVTKGATITGLKINGTITGTDNVGAIIGFADENTQIINCVSNAAVKGKNYIGGIVGKLGDNGSLEACYNTGSVTGEKYTGGLIGGANSKSSTKAIIDCFNTGAVTGGDYTGGIAGYLHGAIDGAKIEGCFNTGRITGKDLTAGLFGGKTTKPLRSSIQYCYNSGEIISSGAYIGGIIAYIQNGTHISNCYNTGKIISSSTSAKGVGGISGSHYAKVTGGMEVVSVGVNNCFNYGIIEAMSLNNVGAITGAFESKAVNENENCYYLATSISSPSDKDKVYPKTSDEFANGELSYILDNGSGNPRSMRWSQDTVNGYPIFADKENLPVYKVIVNSSTGGVVSDVKYSKARTTLDIDINTKYVKAGSRQALTITPDANKILSTISVIDSENNKLDIEWINETPTFYMPEDSVTVSASFINTPTDQAAKYVVNFNGDGGTSVSNQTIKVGNRATKPTNPTKMGFQFDGWYLGDTFYDFNNAVTGDITLKAHWRLLGEFRVNFNLNRNEDSEGSTTPDWQIITSANPMVIEPEQPIWSSKDASIAYEFEGWYTKKAGGDLWDFDREVTKDMTLYAHWISNDGFAIGTAEKPALINTPEALKSLAQKVNSGITYKGCYIKLNRDINLNSGDAWKAIGYHVGKSTPAQFKNPTPEDGSLTFEGTFDGGGNTITLKSDATYPLFGCIGLDGIVKNLNVNGTLDNTKRQNFGGICGYNFGTISGCSINITDNATTNGMAYGGITGGNIGTIENCDVEISVTAGQYTGGIAGMGRFTTIKNCTLKSGSSITSTSGMSAGIIGCVASTIGMGTNMTTGCVVESGVIIQGGFASFVGVGIGGVVGQNAGVVDNCANFATVKSIGYDVGGIVGYSDELTIQHCINKGDISGKGRVGGIFGSGSNKTADIKNCYSTGNINATSGNSGGIVGDVVGALQSCYSTGRITASGNGAAISPIDLGDKLTACYYTEAATDPNKNAIVKSTQAFENGEVAALLDTTNTQKVWTINNGKTVFGSPHYYKAEAKQEGNGTIKLSLNPTTNSKDEKTVFVTSGKTIFVTVTPDTYTGDKTPGYITKYVLESLTLVQDEKTSDILGSRSFKSIEGESLVTAVIVLKNIPISSGSGNGNGDGDGIGLGEGNDKAGVQGGNGTGDTTISKKPVGITDNITGDVTVIAPLEKNADAVGNVDVSPEDGGGNSDDKLLSESEEKTQTVFEIIKKAVYTNPLIAILLGITLLGILGLGGWRQYKKYKREQ